ncbi:16129_t:CDS:1, partial [Cetraspora pellucida]
QAPLKEKRLKDKEINICQVSDSTCSEETIKKTAQHIIKDKLSERDVKVISKILVKTAQDPVVALFCLFRLQRELRVLNVSKKIVSAILNPE